MYKILLPILRYDPIAIIKLIQNGDVKDKNSLFRGGRNNSVCADLVRMQKYRVIGWRTVNDDKLDEKIIRLVGP